MTGLTPRLSVVNPQTVSVIKSTDDWINARLIAAISNRDEEDKAEFCILEAFVLSSIVQFVLPKKTNGRSSQKDALKVRAASKKLHALVKAAGTSSWILADGSSDDCLIALPDIAPALETLVIPERCSFMITDRGIAPLAALPHLRKVSLAWCSQITDDSFATLGGSLPKLETLNAACCSNITDTGVSAIARGCPLLRAIKVDQAVLVSDASIASLAQGCTKLEAVSMAGCTKLTGKAIDSLMACKGLQYLNAAHCEAVPHSTLQKLHETLPDCCVKMFFDSPTMDAGEQLEPPKALPNSGAEEVPEHMILNEPAWVQRTPTCGAKIKAAYSDHNEKMDQIFTEAPDALYEIAQTKPLWQSGSPHWWEQQDLEYTSVYR